jgi:DNA-binding YbaB/EbfC family protein
MQIGNLMKQAQQLQAKMAAMEKQIEAMEVTGESGGGMVKVTLNGHNELLVLKIDPSVVNASDTEMLEDLITAGFNDAKAKITQHVNELRKQLPIPSGMKLPF